MQCAVEVTGYGEVERTRGRQSFKLLGGLEACLGKHNVTVWRRLRSWEKEDHDRPRLLQAGHSTKMMMMFFQVNFWTENAHTCSVWIVRLARLSGAIKQLRFLVDVICGSINVTAFSGEGADATAIAWETSLLLSYGTIEWSVKPPGIVHILYIEQAYVNQSGNLTFPLLLFITGSGYSMQ